MGTAIDITGNTFGRLTALKPVGRSSSMGILWECRCDCGKTVVVAGYRLRNGHTKSCGCLRSDTTRERETKHGKSKTRTYMIWKGMRKRCLNHESKAYPLYGGRGITICDRWYDYGNFLSDMGECPDNMSIDRINVNGNYELSNCRWATQKQQGNNTRRTIKVTIDNTTKSLKEWCEFLGLKYDTVHSRVYRGWSPEKALKKVL